MGARDQLQRAAIVTIALTAPTAILGYPIPPAPLWRLVHDADVIVLATVASVDEPPPAAPGPQGEDGEVDIRGHHIARLRVTETWKGETEADVAVPFEPNMVCPAPPRYEPGATVLAFLVRDDRFGGWQTVHLSYGTLYPPPEAVPVYAARVREALTLQHRKSLDRVDRMEWLVRCSENRATRWDGLCELVGSPKPKAYDDAEHRIRPAELLTDEHRARIAAGFLRDSRLDHNVPLLLDVLGSYRDDRLDRAVVAAIDRELQADEPQIYVLRAAIPAILARLGDEKADSRLPQPGGDWRLQPQIEALRKAWVEAKAAVVAQASN